MLTAVRDQFWDGDVPTGADPVELARASWPQQGLVFMSRTGMDAAALTATARSLEAQLLPDRSGTDRL